jgi:hypothetical protein
LKFEVGCAADRGGDVLIAVGKGMKGHAMATRDEAAPREAVVRESQFRAGGVWVKAQDVKEPP